MALKGIISHLQAYITSMESDAKSPSGRFNSPIKGVETRRTMRKDLMKLFVGYGSCTERSENFENGDENRVNSPFQK